MKLASSLALFAGALALWANACDYPAFKFRATADAGPTSSSSGGQGGSSGGGASPGGSGGSGATGGAPPACANIGQQDSCGTGFKCTVIDPTAGTIGCTAAGPTPDFQACTANEQCGVSSWCDDATGVCRPICVDAATCTGTFALGPGSTCSATQQGGQTVLGGLKVCTADCNPLDNTPCISGDPAVSCAWRAARNDWDCMVSGGAGDGGGCLHDWDCSPGLLCGPDGTCQPLCTTIGGCCDSCVLSVCAGCYALTVPEAYGGQTLGACYDASDWPPQGLISC